MAKKFDFKSFLLQRGEQIGLVVAGLLMLLLVVPAALSFFTAGSSSEKAETLDKKSVFVENALRDPNNLPTEADKPPPDAKKKLIKIKSDQIDPDQYLLRPLVPEGGGIGGGRRPPKVYPIDEAKASFARLQMKAYMFVQNSNPPKIWVLRSEDGGKSGPAGMANPGSAGMMTPGRPQFGGGSQAGLGSLLSQAPKRGGRLGSLFAVPDQGKGEEGKQDRRLKDVLLSEVDKSAAEPPATRVQPLRVAVIAASFPYKKQIEEFRTRLGLKNNDTVLAESSTELRPESKEPLANFRFVGLEVQRRELDGNGNPVGDFVGVDLGEYKFYLVLAGKEVEQEDPELRPIIFPGLVMPRLKQLRGDEAPAGASGPGMTGPGSVPPLGAAGGPRPAMGGSATGPRPGMLGPGGPTTEKPKLGPTADQYPDIEKKLETIQKTLEAIKDKPAEVAAPQRFRNDDIDPFSPPSEAPATGGIAGGPGLAGAPGLVGGTEAKPSVLPEHCLVRVIDVTIQPGKTYEYRMRVRMANPNYGRRDVASPSYSRDAELKSEWSKVPIQVRVDPELHYYAVDEKVLKQQKAGPGKRDKYTGPYANNMVHGNLFNPNTQVMLQVHRWLEKAEVSPGTRVDVGEWVVAERMPAYRGEYVGQRERIEVPYWRTTRAEWVVANDGKDKRFPGVWVPFGHDAPNANQPEAILIDFSNGPSGYNRVVSQSEEKGVEATSVADASAGELLILNPDGKLILREGAEDATDKDRETRLEKYKERIGKVKDPGKAGKEGPRGGGDFRGT
jgi:hypothetical protein